MGCWSESCALSGMEISPGDEVLMAEMTTHPYNLGNWMFSIPPILGKYNDYGGIEQSETSALFNVGTDWDTVASEKAVFFRKDVFDSLAELPVEFKYHGDTIRKQHDRYMKEVKLAVENSIQEALVQKIYIPVHLHLDFFDQDRFMLSNMIHSGVTNFDEFYKFISRCYYINAAALELRKNISPGIRGPQHNGEEALLVFYKKVIELTDKRIKEREEY